MKFIIKTFILATALISLVACNSPNTTEPKPALRKTHAPGHYQTASHCKHHHGPSPAALAKQCAAVKAKLRKIDRSAPGSEHKIVKLEKKLASLNCSVK